MSVHDGHRKRLDKKVLEQSYEMLEAHEQLEHLLFAVIPRGDTNAIAHRLLRRFITVGAVLHADVEELMKIEGVGQRTAMFLTNLPKLLGIVERSMAKENAPKLDSYEKITDFAKSYFYGKLIEEVYVISLDASCKLLAISKVSKGVQGEAGVSPAVVVRQALNDNASQTVVVHNHPCGVLSPSGADVNLSAMLKDTFASIGIDMIDSLIVSGGECYSIATHYDLDRIIREKKRQEIKEK
ncbi:MAG: RadC family protein [Clostridia bacterium]|nr:RadC family protein [Clostridia bacterium]